MTPPAGTEAGIAAFLPISGAAELTNIGILLAFVVVCIAVLVLRHRRPGLPRSFRRPWMPVIPEIGVVFSLWLISFPSPDTWLWFAIWLLVGLIYLANGRRRSRLPRTDDRASRGVRAGAR